MLHLLLLAGGLGCARPGEPPFTGSSGTTPSSTTPSGTTPTTAPLPEWIPVYDGACPAFAEGANTITSAGLERDFQVKLPDDPEGAPLVFFWHWLGGTARQAMDWTGFGDFAEAEGAVVVAPSSTGTSVEWSTYDPVDEANIDLALFDDLVACAWQELGIDAHRVFVSGMSAGGLWSTVLTMHRADVIASSVVFSGGTGPSGIPYAAPSRDLPVAVVWGGPEDTYGGFLSFHDASLDLSENLQADGNFVVECEHDLGHTLPFETPELAWAVFEAHPRAVAPEPWADDLPGALPDYCRLP